MLFWPGLNPFAPWQLDEAGPIWAERYGFRVLAISPPGWETPPLPTPEYRPTALAARIAALLDALELTRVAFIGFSWGASIGCHFAAAYPERLSALVLLDAGYTDFQDFSAAPEREIEEVASEVRAQGRFASMDDYLDAMRVRVRAWRPALEERSRPAVEERVGAVVVRASPEAVAAAGHGVYVERPSGTLPALGRLDAPTLLVTASDTIAQDGAQRALERFRTAVPHAEVHELESGHDLLADAPEETIDLVGSWLAKR